MDQTNEIEQLLQSIFREKKVCIFGDPLGFFLVIFLPKYDCKRTSKAPWPEQEMVTKGSGPLGMEGRLGWSSGEARIYFGGEKMSINCASKNQLQ